MKSYIFYVKTLSCTLGNIIRLKDKSAREDKTFLRRMPNA